MYYCNTKNHFMLKNMFFIALGGAIGSVLRYLMTVICNIYWTNIFPLATTIVNVSGCFLLGLIVGYLQKNNLLESNLKWFLVTGICGGFTTFSTFGFENQQLLSSQNYLMSMIYIGASIFFGILAVSFGLFVTKL